MSKFCPNCGTQMPDEAAFCPNCGNAVGQRTPQFAPTNAQPEVQMVTPNIGLGPDGKYRWIYEMNLFRNPSLFVTVWKIFFFICIGSFVFIAIIQAFEGDLDGEAALDLLKICGIVLAVMTGIIIISFLIYAAIMGGKYVAMFEMDEDGITHGQLPRQAQKAMGIAAAALIIGMLSKRPSTMAAGFAAANTEMYTSFAKTKKVRFDPRHDTIRIRQTLAHNQIYAKPEDFTFVENYILHRVPDGAKPKM